MGAQILSDRTEKRQVGSKKSVFYSVANYVVEEEAGDAKDHHVNVRGQKYADCAADAEFWREALPEATAENQAQVSNICATTSSCCCNCS